MSGERKEGNWEGGGKKNLPIAAGFSVEESGLAKKKEGFSRLERLHLFFPHFGGAGGGNPPRDLIVLHTLFPKT